MTIDLLLDYIRLICYGLVIASSIASMGRKRFSKCILFADMLFALLLAMAMVFKGSVFFGLQTQDYIITPAVIIWATLHYYNLLKQ